MNVENNSIYCLSQVVEVNKNFLYKGKKFPIDFDLIKRSSKFFKDHHHTFDLQENIELKEPIDLSDDAIQIFIDCCQFKNVSFSDSNIFDVNYLSIKYQITGLKRFTEDYIEQNYDNLIFQALLFKQKLQNLTESQKSDFFVDSTKEEEILASHLDEYFNDERILQLPIQLLDRILNKYLTKNQYDNQKISSFLIFCLRHHKQNASILFLNLDFDKFDKELIVNLYTEFENKFDFNMINAKSLFKTTYELLSELENTKLKMEQILQRQNDELNKISRCKQNIEEKQENFESNLTQITNDNLNETNNKINEIQTIFKDKHKNLEIKQNDLENKQNSIELKLKDFWPVGSIYQTFNDQFDPNVYWGGTWIKVEGKFILGSSSSYILNSEGGEENHLLTVDEMPSHSHSYEFRSTGKSGNDTSTVISY